MKYEVHISDVRAFKTCRRKWNWSSPLRRNLEPDIPYAPFFTGRAIHYCLEMYYRNGAIPIESYDKWLENEMSVMEQTGTLWPTEKQKLDEQSDLILGMLDHYFLWVDNDSTEWGDPNLDFIDMEITFSVPLRTGTHRSSSKVFLAGRFDGLVRSKKTGEYWIWETKTTRSIAELSRSLANDEQAGAYIYAAQEIYHVPVQGILYNIMRKKIPAEPRLLADGFLSRQRNIDTTADYYLDAVRRAHPGITPADIIQFYGDVIQHLLDQGNKFFARIPVFRSSHEITQLAEDLHTVALEMTRESIPLYPTPSWTNCNFCHFRAPCLAMNAGANHEFLLENEYRNRIHAFSWLESGDFDGTKIES